MDQPFGSNPGAPTALAAPERNQYFYGKLLDVPHLRLEQEYLNSKRWLMNLLLYGRGVVSGLAVVLSAQANRLVIQPGVAIDGWGREVIVPAMSIPFDPRATTDDDGKPTGTQNGAGSVTISICYQECGIDPAPVLIANCDPAGNCASSSTREQYAVIVKAGTLAPSPLACNFSNIFKPPPNSSQLPDLHAALAARVGQAYADPTGLGCIPLAQIDLPATGDTTDDMIVNAVRPTVVNNNLLLELIFCLAQRVQELAQPAPMPTPTPTPTPTV
jgi:hypothetical protein